MHVTDPVCGKQFEIDRSVAAAEHKGWMYFFCSSDCERRFTSEPHRYEEPRVRARATTRRQEAGMSKDRCPGSGKWRGRGAGRLMDPERTGSGQVGFEATEGQGDIS